MNVHIIESQSREAIEGMLNSHLELGYTVLSFSVTPIGPLTHYAALVGKSDAKPVGRPRKGK